MKNEDVTMNENYSYIAMIIVVWNAVVLLRVIIVKKFYPDRS